MKYHNPEPICHPIDSYEMEEAFLISQIKTIQAEYQKAAQPFVDKLVELRSLRVTPIIMFREQYETMMTGSGLKEM